MANHKQPELTLVAAEHSYFSAKARSYLRFKGQQGVLFQEALATLDMYKTAILPMVGVNFIPVLLVHDSDGKVKEAIQDTSLIIDYVEAKFPRLPSVHPTSPKQRFVSYLIELWADEWLKMPAMHYRWSFLEENKKYLVWEWGRVSEPKLSATQRDNNILNSKSKGPSFNNMRQTLPLLGINESTSVEVENSFLRLLSILEDHFRDHKYLLGGRPCLGDFALIGPMYAHLFRDPKPSAIMRSSAPAFCEYIERMNGLRPAYDGIFEYDNSKGSLVAPSTVVGQLGRVPMFGEFFPNDEIPKTIVPLLSLVFEEHVPVLLSTCEELKRHVAAESIGFDKQLPRTIGFHAFKIGKTEGNRLAYPYDVWMLQRCMDSISDESVVHPFIKSFPNGDALLSKWGTDGPDLRLRLVKFKLYRDPSKPPRPVQSML